MPHYRNLQINNDTFLYHVGGLVVIRHPISNKKVVLTHGEIGSIKKSHYCDCGSTDCLAHSFGYQVTPADIKNWIVKNWGIAEKQDIPRFVTNEAIKTDKTFLPDRFSPDYRNKQKEMSALLSEHRKEYKEIYGV